MGGNNQEFQEKKNFLCDSSINYNFPYYFIFPGCMSWKWYFPFHYAPFASDFTELETIDSSFPAKTHPKKPLEQLMCVFPAASGQFLPTAWRNLMSDPVRLSCKLI